MTFSFEVGSYLFDLLLKLAGIRDKRRRDIFEEFLTPIFEKFVEVHAAYNELFLTTERSFPMPVEDNLCMVTPGEPYDALDGERCQSQVAKTKDDFSRARRENEWIRDDLRQQAQQLLKAVSHIEEKRFLLAIVLYFLGDGHTGVDNQLDGLIERVEQRGGYAALNSPSSRLLADLQEATDLKIMRALVETARHDLNQRFSDVSGYYTRAKLAVYTQTTD